MLSAPQIATGPAAMIAADAVRKVEERRDTWPYPWAVPPPRSERRNPTGFVTLPAPAAQAEVLSFTVSQGFKFELIGVMFCPVGANFVIQGSPGDYLWTIDKNTPLGSPAAQSYILADFNQVGWPFGSPTGIGWIPLGRSETFEGNDTIRIKVTTVNGGGSPLVGIGMLVGWLHQDS